MKYKVIDNDSVLVQYFVRDDRLQPIQKERCQKHDLRTGQLIRDPPPPFQLTPFVTKQVGDE